VKSRVIRSSLRARIIAWSFVPTTLILMAIALTIFFAYQRVTEDLVVGKNAELTRRAAGQLAGDLGSYADTLTTLARNADMVSADVTRQTSALQQAADRLVVFDGGLVILDHLGRVVATAPDRREWLRQDWSSLSFFQQMMHSTGAAYSDILPGEPAEVGVAVPILGERGEWRGTLIGLFQLGTRSISALYGGIVKLRINDGGDTYLVDSTGRAIYHSNEELIGAHLGTSPTVLQVLNNQSGYLRTRDASGRDILASFAPVPGTPWGLISEEQWSDLLSATQGYGQFLVVLLALGVIVPTLVVTIGVKRITDPIAQLIAAAKEIASGQFGQQITVRTGDELEELVKQFNHMSEELSASYAQLEQRVAARTHELETLNAISAVVSRSLDVSEVLNAALSQSMEVMNMEFGAAYRADKLLEETPDRLTLNPIAFRGFSEAGMRYGRSLAYQDNVLANAVSVATTGTPVIWTTEDLPIDHGLRQVLKQEGIQLFITIPLMAKAGLVGIINLGTREVRAITPEQSSLLAAIGQQIGIALENAHLYDQAEQAAATAERQRLSRELHDSVTQSLYSITMYAEASARLLSAGKTTTAVEHLRELRDTAREALRGMRLLIFELRPLALEKTGLAAALQARLDSVEMRGGLTTDLTVEGSQNPEQSSRQVEEELYHISQEALNNVIKHSQAQHVQVTLHFSDVETRLEIRDDGVGFEPSAMRNSGGLGLAGLRERAEKIGARLDIISSPGKGTEIRVVVPCHPVNGVDQDIEQPTSVA